jgi:hypothetical protein
MISAQASGVAASMTKGVILTWGDKTPCTIIEDRKSILVVTEDINKQPCPEGRKRYFKPYQGNWAECVFKPTTNRWAVAGEATLVIDPPKK